MAIGGGEEVKFGKNKILSGGSHLHYGLWGMIFMVAGPENCKRKGEDWDLEL